jgi:hypothetical protein
MAIVNGYTTLALLRQHLGYAAGDLLDDGLLEQAIEAASRMADGHCLTRFFTTAADETRYYTAQTDRALRLCDGLDDILSVAAIALDSTGDRSYSVTLATTDYDLLPANALLNGRPYTRIELTPGCSHVLPLFPLAVKITGKFGYSSATPPMVQAACKILAAYMFKLKDSPLGIAGNTEIGEIISEPKVAKMVLQMLAPIRLRRDGLVF